MLIVSNGDEACIHVNELETAGIIKNIQKWCAIKNVCFPDVSSLWNAVIKMCKHLSSN